MGFKVPMTRIEGSAERAAHRWHEGHTIHCVTLLFADLTQWGDIIEAIEGAGFRLEHLELAKEGHAVAVFRRVSA